MGQEKWSILTRALKFYEIRGATYIEVPWGVEEQYIKETNTDFNIEHAKVHRDGYNLGLVGSAEQSFLAIYSTLEFDEMYMAVTPCFRQEPAYTEIHRPYFMKLELFMKLKSKIPFISLARVIETAGDFFSKELNIPIYYKEIYPKQIDIIGTTRKNSKEEHIELGSYGIREFKGSQYVYGTGIALERYEYYKS